MRGDFMRQYYIGPIRRVTATDLRIENGEAKYNIKTSKNSKNEDHLEWDAIIANSTIIDDNIEFYYNSRQKLLTKSSHFPVTRAEDVHDIIVNDILSGNRNETSVTFVNPLELTRKTLSEQKPKMKQRMKSIFKKGAN